MFFLPGVVSGSARFGPLAGGPPHLFCALPGLARRRPGQLGSVQALLFRQAGTTLRRRNLLRAVLPSFIQLAPRPATLGELMQAGLLAEPVPMLALAAVPRSRPLGS